MTILIEAKDLTKTYDRNTVAVNHINLTIPSGKVIGLLGPNGSGKTTLIKMINGLLAPTSGQILIESMKPGPETKKHIAYLPDRTFLENNRKICELIDFFADFYEDFQKDKAYAMLQSLNISSNAKVKTLSKGNKEKVQLILVMSRKADLYILDEPIAGVDPAARDFILRTIITNYNPEASILISTHLISDVETVLDEVIFIKNGNIALQCSVDDIRAKQGKSVDSYFREVFAC